MTAPILSVNYLFLFKVSGCGAEGCLGPQFQAMFSIALFGRPILRPGSPQILFTLSNQD